MPMTNGESRQLALTKCYARSVHAFSQQGPNCTAYVAMWLRKRSRNKPFFSGDYFRVTDVEDRVTRHVETLADVVMAQPLPGNRAELPRNQTKGAEKAEAFQALMVGNRAFERGYITTGSKQRTTSLAFVDDRSAQAMSERKPWDGKGIAGLIADLNRNKRMASVGIFTRVPHALGIDCSTKYPAYFDPNLGELTFANAEWLAYWWRKCYSADRSERPATTMLSAWRDMADGTFSAEIYQRV